MYCINCGVELADHEKKCPLCGTPVSNPGYLHPKAPTPYPPAADNHEEMNRSGVLFVLTFLFLLPILLTLTIDLSLNERMVWSGYPISALLLGYLVIVLPTWFRHPNPVIFTPVDFAGIAGLLWYVNFATGGDWFLTFALPVTAMIGGIVTAVVALTRYVPRGILYILGGASILTGLSVVGTELLLNYTFHFDRTLVWSAYPLVVFVLLGIMLIVIALCSPLQESLKRKFFV